MSARPCGRDRISRAATQNGYIKNCDNVLYYSACFMIHTSHPTWKRYLVAVLTVAGGLLIRLPLVSLLGTTVPYITFFPAIAVSAGYGGFIGGLIATILSAVAAFYFVIHFGSLADLIRGPEAIGSVIFLFVGTMLSWWLPEPKGAQLPD